MEFDVAAASLFRPFDQLLCPCNDFARLFAGAISAVE